MNKLELIEQRNTLKSDIESIITKGESEMRKLNDGENSDIAEKRKQIADIDIKLAELEKENEKLSKSEKNNNKRNMKKNYSIRQALLEVVENRQLSEQTVELKELATRSQGTSANGDIQFPITLRGLDTTTSGSGAELVFDEATEFLFPITEGSVLSKLGAKFMTDLKGNLVFTSGSGISAEWKPEGQESSDGSGNFTNIVMKPKRLCAQIPVAKSLLMQSSYDVEMMLRKMISDKIAEAVDVAFLDGHASDANTPDSILSVDGVTSITCAEGKVNDALIDMESAVSGYGDFVYLMNPVAKGTLKKTKLTEGKFILEGNEANGYPVTATRAIGNDKAVVMGDFSNVYVGIWGDLDIVADKNTLAGKGMIRFVVNFYADVVCVRPESFSKTVIA